MKIVEEGRVYGVRNFDSDDHQTIKFTRKRYDGTFSDGTTVEEIIRMLRDKFYHFNKISPSKENDACIHMCDGMLRQMIVRLENKRKEIDALRLESINKRS
jgi:hypothetical protein